MKSSVSHSESPTRIQSARRAASLLLLVAQQSEGLRGKEAAAALEVPVPTAHHLLATLVDEGLLARDGQRRFVLGPRVGVLADAFLRNAIPDWLAAPLQRLAEEAAETAYLTAWRDGAIHALASVEGASAVRVGAVPRGPYRHPHARATGKLLLSFARPDQRDRILERDPLEALTPNTIIDRVALDAELEKIRRRGWAEDREEYAEGVSCVAAPVLLDGVAVAAYTVSAPSERFRRRRRELREAVKRASAAARGGQGLAEAA
jgi:IclR family transcriptional regulator, acetate operon repressor